MDGTYMQIESVYTVRKTPLNDNYIYNGFADDDINDNGNR